MTQRRPPARRPAPARRPPPRRRAPVRLARLGDPGRRLRTGFLLMAFVLSLFVGRLLQLQGIDASTYARAAEVERLRTVTLPATRGSITDVHGTPLATTVDARIVTADQTLIAGYGGAAAVAAKVAPILKLDPANLESELTGTRRYVVLARTVKPEVWRRVQRVRIDGHPLIGIYSEPESKRTYPAGQVGANVVGFVNREQQGRAGIEEAMDGVLSGTDGQLTYETAAGGRQIPTGVNAERPPVPGEDVRLTIDRDIQWYAQRKVAAVVHSSGSSSGTAVVMDPRTGHVLALATFPSFDPSNIGASPKADLGDRPVQEAYEPGSTGKVMTAAALIQEKAVTPMTKFSVPNRLYRAGESFKDFEDHGTEQLTYAGTIAKSSNIGTMMAAERLGLKKLYPYFKKFGIGQATGIGLPGETAGALPPPRTWSASTGYTMAFGQGYSVNTVRMASTFATIANGGLRVQPSIVAGTTDATGRVHAPPAPKRTRVVTARTANTVRRMLEGVLGEGGTAPSANIPGYRVAGKTGTAQKFEPKCSCYRGFTMSFIGFAPADKPALVVAVTLQDAHGIGGGVVAGPVFKDIMSFGLQTLQVPPTGAKPPKVKLTWSR